MITYIGNKGCHYSIRNPDSEAVFLERREFGEYNIFFDRSRLYLRGEVDNEYQT